MDSSEQCALSVVIPVYNEERSLERIVEVVRNVPIRKEIIIIVDDCSKDDSYGMDSSGSR